MIRQKQVSKYAKLRDASRKGDKQTARQLILNDAPVNDPRSTSNSPLHWAISKFKDTEIIQMLLDRKANIHAKNHNRLAPLDIAVQSNKLEAIKLLINKGALIGRDVNLLLHEAIKRRNKKSIKFLIDHCVRNNPSINLKNSLNAAVEEGLPEIVTYLMPYCQFHKFSDKWIPKKVVLGVGQAYKDCVNLLLEQGFTINPDSNKNENFVYSAVEKEYTAIVQELLKLGINVNMVKKETGLALLHVACLNKHLEITKLLLKYKANVNVTVSQTGSSNQRWMFNRMMNLNGKTALYIAVENFDAKMTQLLLHYGAKISDGPNYSNIATVAVQNGCQEIVDILLHHGVNVNQIDASGNTLLYYCVMYTYCYSSISSKHKIAKLLLKKGAHVNAKIQHGETLIFEAIKNKYFKVVQVFLDYNANVQHKNTDGNTPLHEAVRNSFDPEIIEAILKRKAVVNAVNKKGLTSLFIACQTESSNAGIVKKLLHYGANINCVDKIRRTPLHYACDGKNLEVIRNLLKRGANSNVKDKNGKTPLHYICEAWRKGDSSDMINLLLRHNASIDAVDEKGWTPLFTACKAGHVSSIKCLLENNANVHYTGPQGITALRIVTENYVKNSEIIKLLLKHKANINFVNREGKSLIHFVAENNYWDVIDMLAKLHVNFNSVDTRGCTALHLATEEGHLQMIESLIKYGANINIFNKNRRIALRYAIVKLKDLQEEIDYYRGNNDDIFSFLFNITNSNESEDENEEEIDLCEENISTYQEIVKMFKEHIIKLKCAGLEVNGPNLEYVYDEKEENEPDFSDNERDVDVSKINIVEFECYCELEMEKMRMEKIGSSYLTFYNLLTKSITFLSRYGKNESIRQALESNNYRTKFPLYIDILKNRFAEGLLRRKVSISARKYFHSNIVRDLPPNCLDTVFSYLNTRELKKFINAVRPSNK